jgi:hypothetical protein
MVLFRHAENYSGPALERATGAHKQSSQHNRSAFQLFWLRILFLL